MQDLKATYEQALSYQKAGDYAEAYQLFLHLAKAEPLCEIYRLHLAEICVSLGRSADALRIYKHLAANLVQQGKIVQAIAVSKRILELNPEEREIQEQLSQLYGQAVDVPQSAPPAKIREIAQAPLTMPQGASIFEHKNVDLSISGFDNFYNIGPTLDQVDVEHLTLMGQEPPNVLPVIPLFSDLPPKAFGQVMERCKRFSVTAGAILVRQGEPGDSIFIVSYGALRVLRKVKEETQLAAELKPGDFYGEFAYFSRKPREASLVATEAAEVLEITRALMDEICLQNPKVERALQNLYKERVLINLLRESELFATLSEEERMLLCKRFSHLPVPAQKVIVREGDPADSFYVIQSGSVQVVKSGVEKPLAVLKEGEFFGEFAMITGSPRSASVIALEPTQLVTLTRDVFRDLLKAKPEILEKVMNVAKSRIAQNQTRK